MASCWSVLGVEPTDDKRLIKRAYSTLLKKTKPESDPKGYQLLREAFDQAIKIVKQRSNSAQALETTTIPPDISMESLPTHKQSGFSEQIARPETHKKEDQLEVRDAKTEDIFEQAARQAILVEQRGESERLAKQLLAENNQRELKRTQEERIKRTVDEIFNGLDQTGSIKQFEQLIFSEEFINIHSRRQLDEQCFYVATNWPAKVEFPGVVFKAMAEEFAWFQPEIHNSWDQEKLDYLFNRLRAHENLIALQALAARRAWGKEKSRIHAARILLSKFSKNRFLRITLLGSHYETLKATVNAYRSDVENGFLPELDTPTFTWWVERFKSHYFGMAHLLGGMIVGVVIVAVMFNQLQSTDTFIHPGIFLGVLIGSAVPGSVIFWSLGWASSKGWKVAVNYYQEQVRYWIHTPKVYRCLTVIYLITFILPIFWPELWLIQILGYCLVWMTLGASVVFALMGGAAYELSMTLMQLNDWSDVISTDFILAGLIANYTFFRIIRSLQGKLAERIINNGVLILLVYFAYSILIATALLQSTLIIINGLNISSITG
jgi:hypothetical protein